MRNKRFKNLVDEFNKTEDEFKKCKEEFEKSTRENLDTHYKNRLALKEQSDTTYCMQKATR